MNPQQLCDKLYSDFLIQGPVVLSCAAVEGDEAVVKATIGGRLADHLVGLKAVIYLLMVMNADCSEAGDELSSDRLHEAMEPLARIVLQHDKDYADRN